MDGGEYFGEEMRRTIVALNERLVRCATLGSWEAVARLEAERRTLLRAWMEAEGWTANTLIVSCVQHSVEVDRKVVRLKYACGRSRPGRNRLPVPGNPALRHVAK